MKHSFWFIPFLCLSCAGMTPQQQLMLERASRIADRALTYAEAKGKISPEDAALVRDVGTIALEPAAPTPSK